RCTWATNVRRHRKTGVAVVSRAFRGAANRAGHAVDRHINHRLSREHILGLADVVESRTGSGHPRGGRLAEWRHRGAPRNLIQDHRYPNVVNLSETDDQLTRGDRSFRSAGPAQPGVGGTLPYSTPKPRQTTINTAPTAKLIGTDACADADGTSG